MQGIHALGVWLHLRTYFGEHQELADMLNEVIKLGARINLQEVNKIKDPFPIIFLTGASHNFASKSQNRRIYCTIVVSIMYHLIKSDDVVLSSKYIINYESKYYINYERWPIKTFFT